MIAIVSLFVYLFSIRYVSTLTVPPAQSLSQGVNLRNEGSLRLPTGPSNNTSIISSSNSTFRSTRLGNANHFECSPHWGDHLDIASIYSAWQSIPKDPNPLTFGRTGEVDVHLPKRFLGSMSSLSPKNNIRHINRIEHRGTWTLLTLCLRLPGNGRVEFAIAAVESRPDIDSYLHMYNTAGELIRRCAQGHPTHWGGVATGLGKIPLPKMTKSSESNIVANAT